MHVGESGLTALAALEVRQRLVLALPLELAVEMGGEERKEALAFLGELLGVDLDEPQLLRSPSRARKMSCATAFSFIPTSSPISA